MSRSRIHGGVRTRSESLIVAGMHLGGAGYPNAQRTLQLLGEQHITTVVERGYWLPEDFRLWQIFKGSLPKRLMLLSWFAVGNLWSAVRALPTAWWNNAPIYVPYPAVPLLWLLSWLPRRIRPLLIADSFISIWDSLVIDRGQAGAQGMIAKLLRLIEGRALRAADCVVTDTEASVEYLQDTFDLAVGSLRSMPLAVSEPIIVEGVLPAVPGAGERLRVLYVGTLVPLHGINRVLQGIEPLIEDSRFEFVFLGDGQDAAVVESFAMAYPNANLRWIRDWQTSVEVDAWIRSADVCLGVFGGEGKASRVLPFKIYLYLAQGSAVITQSAMSLPHGAPLPPVVGIDPSRPEQITAALLALGSQPETRKAMGREAKDYYSRYLCNARVADAWRALLKGLSVRT